MVLSQRVHVPNNWVLGLGVIDFDTGFRQVYNHHQVLGPHNVIDLLFSRCFESFFPSVLRTINIITSSPLPVLLSAAPAPLLSPPMRVLLLSCRSTRKKVVVRSRNVYSDRADIDDHKNDNDKSQEHAGNNDNDKDPGHVVTIAA